MPNTKRLKKGSGAAKTEKAPKAKKETADEEHPTPAEVEEEEHQFVQLARKHWLKAGKKAKQPKVKNDVLKQGIWDVLDREGFQYKSLRLLESLQTLERYVPKFDMVSIPIINANPVLKQLFMAWLYRGSL